MRPVPFVGGNNVTIKVPPQQFAATVQFYRDALGLPPLTVHPPAVGFVFGTTHLWIDASPGLSRAEVWLELTTPDPDAASRWLTASGVSAPVKVRPVVPGFSGFWVANPASIVHRIARPDGY